MELTQSHTTSTDASGNVVQQLELLTLLIQLHLLSQLQAIIQLQLSLGGTYTEAGATATDASQVTVTVATSGTVDADTLGTYTITYTSTDASGNVGTATEL